MLKLNPHASVTVIDAGTPPSDNSKTAMAHAVAYLKENKSGILDVALRLRCAPRNRELHREYLALLSAAGIAPTYADKFFHGTTITLRRRALKMSLPVGTVYPLKGADNLKALRRALGNDPLPVSEEERRLRRTEGNTRARKLREAAKREKKALETEKPSDPGAQHAAVFRGSCTLLIEGYPNLRIQTRTNNILKILEALKHL
jgi:hypothetical protein